MNSFQRFNISHLSPSALNLWTEAPGIWARQYVGRQKDTANPAMERGTAVEKGMEVLLLGRSVEEAISAAQLSFSVNAVDTWEPAERTAEYDLIAPQVRECTKWARPSNFLATQQKIEYWLDPIPIPVIGWLDFSFEETDVDCKSTKACPSAPKASHIRQVSIYRAARNKPGGIFYVTKNKHAYFSITDEMMNEGVMEMQAAALSLSNFLARMETKEDVLRSLPIDYSNYRAPKSKVPLAEILLGG